MQVMEWRKSGKPLTKEQEYLANKVVDEMISIKTSGQTGCQLISKSNIDFIKGQQPQPDGNAVAGITQDVVSNVQDTSGEFPLKTKKKISVVDSVEKGIKTLQGEKVVNLPDDVRRAPKTPRQTPDAQNIKLDPPSDQAEGEVTSVEGSAVDAVQPDSEVKVKVEGEELGHQPNEPMPKKMAQDLINNAKWGTEIGAYTNIAEGIDRQLGRKMYGEFIDTDEKLKAVTAYLKDLIPSTDVKPVGTPTPLEAGK